jgi:hypothetical protein
LISLSEQIEHPFCCQTKFQSHEAVVVVVVQRAWLNLAYLHPGHLVEVAEEGPMAGAMQQYQP